MDDMTIDSWGGMTNATSALLYRDGKYLCTKHSYESESPTCILCERDFQDQRQSLKEKRESVKQQLQDLGDQDVLAELQDSLQKWKPAAEHDDDRGFPPRPDQHNHHHQEQSYRPPSPPEPPTTLATVPPMDALTMQIQGMQRMQDWMLYQKEQECQELRKRLEDILHENSSLRVENARLTEKLTQQEQRMQHELKLIKMAHQQRMKKEVVMPRVDTQPSVSSSKSTGQVSEEGDLPSLQSPTKNHLPAGISYQRDFPSERRSPVIAGAKKYGGVTPSNSTSSNSNAHSSVPIESIDVGPPTVPLEEGITMGTAMPTYQRKVVQQVANIEQVTPKEPAPVVAPTPDPPSKVSFVDESASVAHTVASSTYGEDRQYVQDETILDPYGDKGHYTGMVLKSTGMPHGKGKMVYTEDNRTFDGEWRHGRWHGFGVATFSNGDRYEGEYRFDQRHGTGTYSWNDGRKYSGQFAEDKRHGRGTFYWPDSATYEGEFRHGQRDGHGIYNFSDGGKYEGGWKDGRYEGYGVCIWADGRSYKGNWKNGMAHGKGVETFADGRIRHDGMWREDEPVL